MSGRTMHRYKPVIQPARAAALASLALIGVRAEVVAHTSVRPTPETVWSSWNLDPLMAIGILIASWLYLRGAFAHRRRTGNGGVLHRWHIWAWGGAMVSLAAATFSPLDAMGEALFSAHMVQHVLLFLVTPMLLAASRPFTAFQWAMPAQYRKRILTWSHQAALPRWVRVIWTNPVLIWMLFTGVLWVWHVPSLYDAALRSSLVHRLEHLSFLVAAFLFWSWLLQSRAGQTSKHGFAVLLVFTSVIQSGLLGAILTFARSPIYDGHLPYTESWGLTGLEDQQLAGLIMWIPMGLWFTLTTIVIFIAWLRDAERSVRRWETDDDGAFATPDAAPSQGR